MLGTLTGGFSGGSGTYSGGAASTGDQYTTTNSSVGGFNINAAPAWAGGVSTGGSSGGAIDQKTLLIGAGIVVAAWFLMRKK